MLKIDEIKSVIEKIAPKYNLKKIHGPKKDDWIIEIDKKIEIYAT